MSLDKHCTVMDFIHNDLTVQYGHDVWGTVQWPMETLYYGTEINSRGTCYDCDSENIELLLKNQKCKQIVS